MNEFGFDLTVAQLDSYMNQYFNVQEPYPLTEAIDDGNVIMTNIPSDIPGSTHNVVIIGYSPDGELVYMDPQRGYIWTAPSDEFSWTYAYIISACN